MLRWLLAFAFTELVEVPLYARALRGDGAVRGLFAASAVGFGASLITHPIVWFAIPRWWVTLYLFALDRAPWVRIESPLARYVAMGVLSECFAVCVEALYLRAWGLRRALVWSLAANALSVTLGLACRAVFGVP